MAIRSRKRENMKHRTDTLAQQYRIRAEYAARKALEALETTRAEWLKLRPIVPLAALNEAVRLWPDADQFRPQSH